MNLNYGYDKDALMALVATADSSFDEHNLVIDFDGEVVLDPEVYYPHVPINCYKFTTKVKDKSLRSNMMATALYDALEMIHDKLNTAPELVMNCEDRQLSIAA